MSISPLSGSPHGVAAAGLAPAGASGFGAHVQLAVGLGRAAHGHGAHANRTQETGSQDPRTGATGAVSAPAGATPAHSLADDTRALVGDLFGALGASTPTMAAAQQAVQAYRRAG